MIFLLLIPIIYSEDLCIYPSFYWRTNNLYSNQINWPSIQSNQLIQTENFTQCGVSWIDLYLLDLTLINQNNLLWLLLFQEYCSASLNLAKINLFLNNMSPEYELLNEKILTNLKNQIEQVNEYINKAFKLLDDYCIKMSDLNYQNNKNYLIDILNNINKINNGVILGYCDDIYFENNLVLDMYSIFQNTSFHDNGTFNDTLSYKPLYFNVSNLRNQFINGNWLLNLTVDKNFTLMLFLSLLLCCFVIVSIICCFYGKCMKIRRKPEDGTNTKCCLKCNLRSIYNICCCCCLFMIKRYKTNTYQIYNDKIIEIKEEDLLDDKKEQ